jgi:hypothetical protein
MNGKMLIIVLDMIERQGTLQPTCFFKSNNLGQFLACRLMRITAAEPLFTPIHVNLVKQTAARELL